MNKKRKRDIEEKNYDIKLNDNTYKNYNKYIKENKIQFSNIIIKQIERKDKKLSKNNEKNFKTFLKSNNLSFSNGENNNNTKINSIFRAYSSEDIKIFNIDILYQINIYIEYIYVIY